ncbi:SDR family oxidoreductase [Hymenobacter arizonensis]|uniref:NAD(P)-dependent dehydrogenase, short-chain alcohol dehydrogenase family n=1 Tax=Hymenobacter arizonensis TaxID=1227077 RepID=A0A1I6BL87_HYMAR|nr:SDR family oxidoreductase [Hymenobacter arizonensis]SFQ81587.1 NAD(P)-dependent dehydrogenase, short-chain alcohol dehydrogenase family [Hymenobacter arizonensis]
MAALDQFSLRDRVIVITGATGVLGECMSLAVAEAGAKVVVLGRDATRAAARVDAIQAMGGEAMSVLCNVLDKGQMQAACEEILAAYGTIDGLVNAAGGNLPGATINPDQDLFDLSIEQTRSAVDLNLFGTVIPTTVFGRVMAEKGKGSIVNVSSLTAQRPLTRVLGYTMAKKAVEAYTQWMATELGLRYGGGVRMNAIAPGVFLTEQNRALLLNPDGSPTDRARKFISHTPFQRFGLPEELTGTLIYLLSDASRFVSGATVMVDGGFNAYSGV